MKRSSILILWESEEMLSMIGKLEIPLENMKIMCLLRSLPKNSPEIFQVNNNRSQTVKYKKNIRLFIEKFEYNNIFITFRK